MEINALDSTVPTRLLEALREWRHEESRELNIPPYWLLSNRSMLQIATQRPGTLESLRAIHGVGEAKVNRYGEKILSIIARYPQEETPPGPPVKGLQPTRVSYPVPHRDWKAVLAAAHIAVPGDVAGLDILVSLQPEDLVPF
ncbi:MAG TPA: HRDC domain-containing protein [Candidatus Xenobia bacterium]|jgi:ribonuclease D